MRGDFSYPCEDTMYFLRIQVLVLVAAYYVQASEERISGARCHGINGGKKRGSG
jgi:hypothetical protein